MSMASLRQPVVKFLSLRRHNLKVSDVKLEDMHRSNELAGLLRKATFTLSLPDLVISEKVLTWLSDLGKSLAEAYQIEAQKDVLADKDNPNPDSGFKVTSWNPTGKKELIKKKKK